MSQSISIVRPLSAVNGEITPERRGMKHLLRTLIEGCQGSKGPTRTRVGPFDVQGRISGDTLSATITQGSHSQPIELTLKLFKRQKVSSLWADTTPTSRSRGRQKSVQRREAVLDRFIANQANQAFVKALATF